MGETFISIYLPDLEYKTIDGGDLGWALWFKKQMYDSETIMPFGG